MKIAAALLATLLCAYAFAADVSVDVTGFRKLTPSEKHKYVVAIELAVDGTRVDYCSFEYYNFIHRDDVDLYLQQNTDHPAIIAQGSDPEYNSKTLIVFTPDATMNHIGRIDYFYTIYREQLQNKGDLATPNLESGTVLKMGAATCQ